MRIASFALCAQQQAFFPQVHLSSVSADPKVADKDMNELQTFSLSQIILQANIAELTVQPQSFWLSLCVIIL